MKEVRLDIPPPSQGGPSQDVLDEANRLVNAQIDDLTERIGDGVPKDEWDAYLDALATVAGWMSLMMQTGLDRDPFLRHSHKTTCETLIAAISAGEEADK